MQTRTRSKPAMAAAILNLPEFGEGTGTAVRHGFGAIDQVPITDP